MSEVLAPLAVVLKEMVSGWLIMSIEEAPRPNFASLMSMRRPLSEQYEGLQDWVTKLSALDSRCADSLSGSKRSRRLSLGLFIWRVVDYAGVMMCKVFLGKLLGLPIQFT